MSQNNSSDKLTMMSYIEEINKSEGFDPTPFAVEYTDLNNGEVRKRLPVIIRIAMFRMKYLQGKIALQTKAVDGGFVATARIYPHYKDAPDEFLAEATAFRGKCPDKPSVSAREWAQTAAIGVALRNAGFGVQFDVGGEDVVETMDENFAITPSESVGNLEPVTETASYDSEPTVVPTDSGEENSISSVYAEDLTPEDKKAAEAMQLMCPIPKHKGKNLGEVLVEDPSAIKWLATKFSGDDKIRDAAILIGEYALKKSQEASNE